MAQSFTPLKAPKTFSDVIFSHLERLSNISIMMVAPDGKPETNAVHNFENGLDHLESMLSPYINKSSEFEKQNYALTVELNDDVDFIDLHLILQLEYIKLLKKKFSLLMTVLYSSNLLETKKDSYEDDEDGSDGLPY